MPKGIPYAEALKHYQHGEDHALPELIALLRDYHPDYYKDSIVELKIGTNV